MSPRISSCLVLLLSACASATAPDVPGGAVATTTLEGTFSVASELELAPAAVGTDALAELLAAADGPDQPMRYVVDRLVAVLPDGQVQTIAHALSPLLTAYLEVKLAEAAPRFVSGIHALGSGLARVAQHVGTREQLAMASDGTATRTITGLRFDVGPPMEIRFADHGRSNVAAVTHVELDDTGRVTVDTHVVTLGSGWLRLGLDEAVIPSVVPGTHDLAAALVALVDCAKLGDAIAGYLGVGTPALYEGACRTGMTAVGNSIYARLAAVDAASVELSVSGAAAGLDHDGDGTIDELSAGTWSGTVGHAGQRAALGAATFTGSRQ